MDYDVRIDEVAARPTAVVAATTTWDRFPALWGELLGEVWACLHEGGIRSGCRNIMLYLDDTPSVEVGVELTRRCALTGRVTASHLPAGRVATTTHRGPYAELGAAHDAVHAWCAGAGERVTRTRWEVYGPNEPVPWTQIFWLLH